MALRTPLSVTPHLYMGDSTGRPLDKGVVYFGEQDKDPEFYPIELFSDDALTKPLAQPVHTKGGYLYDKGDMVEPHAKELIYSVKVLDSYGRKVFYKGAMMRNSWNDDVIEQINTAIIGSADAARQVAIDITNDAINNTAVEGGVLADTFVVVDGSLSQRTINKGLESIAGLSTINNPKDGLRVYVKSYHAGLEKGGGYFTYDSSKTSINDYGYVINGWIRDSDKISVVNFGATGDGDTDDTLAIQRALNTGEKVHIPSGTYLVSNTLTYKTLQEIYGDGHGTQIKSTVVGAPIFDSGTAAVWNCYVHDFVINGSGEETAGFKCSGTFEGFRLARLMINSCGGKAFHLIDTFYFEMYNCWAHGDTAGSDMDYGFYFDGCTAGTIQSCAVKFSKATGAGYAFARTNHSNYALNFIGCMVEACFGDGIHAQHLHSSQFLGCYFEANNLAFKTNPLARASHIRLSDFDGSGTGSRDLKITDCYFNYQYIEHIVVSDSPVLDRLTLDNLHTEEFGAHPHQLKRYKINLTNNSSTLYLNNITPSHVAVTGSNKRIASSNSLEFDSANIRFVYYTAGSATEIGGDVPCTISYTRTIRSGAVKQCSYRIDSVDTSGIPASCILAVIVPASKRSDAEMAGTLTHLGTSASGVIEFYTAFPTTGDNMYIRKKRVTASDSVTARASDLVGVTRLEGHVSYT